MHRQVLALVTKLYRSTILNWNQSITVYLCFEWVLSVMGYWWLGLFYIRYDLKGCSAGRYVKPLQEESKEVIVLKDNNFEGMKIKIGQ